ncbi:unnamed protein product [Brachionus calyciflorus]|uniref:EF-hand domain-containing protein n=1 Tax=Brachionus calyciflorus TaxID=104777 RepID=A0A813M2Y1_9BILA|nr:unnamed protein product [Brachionus calyciflorus]
MFVDTIITETIRLVIGYHVLDLINEKLNTGYHGVKHMFISNDINKTGRLTKESFKWVINQLCGCLSNDTWNKIVHKFKLNENETISFEEFISFFNSNQKVKKELASTNKNIQLIDFKSSSMNSLLSQRDLSKKIPLPELSASYCLSLIKLKAVQKEFDPKNVLAEECFTKNIILPHHLKHLLNLWELKISNSEFHKLWTKFDIYNTGCCRTQLFLRLINYKFETNQSKKDLTTSESCVVEKNVSDNLIDSNCKQNNSLDTCRTKKTIDLIDEEVQEEFYQDEQPQIRTEILENEIVPSNEQIQNEECELKEENNEISDFDIKIPETLRSEHSTKQDRRIDSSLSEKRIKSMVYNLKKSKEYRPNDDLIAYLNNKLNEGFIVLRAAFEYIDQDNLGHLFSHEFRTVLDEFKIYTDAKLLNKFLKTHGLLKNDQLVDYIKFLKVFQDRDSRSAYRQLLKNGESLGESTCLSDQIKKSIEHKFLIRITEAQFEKLKEFLNIDSTNSKVNWEILFNKFSEIDPWNMFKDTYEKSSKKSRKISGSTIKSTRSKSLLNFNIKNQRLMEFNEPLIEENPYESDFSNDDEDLKSSEFESDEEIFSSIVDFTKKRDRMQKKSKFTEFSKKFQDDLKVIRNLEKKVEAIIRLQFHSINKYFSGLDPQQTECIDKETFRLLMIKCGANFTSEQIDLLWKDFEADSIPFSNFLRRFFRPDEFNNFREIRQKIKLEKHIREENRNNEITSRLNTTSQIEFKSKYESNKKKTLTIFQKVKPTISQNWNQLKNDFKAEDKLSKFFITIYKAYDILRKYQIELNEKELHELCDDFLSNGTNFDYVKFLKFFRDEKTESKNLNWNGLNPILIGLIKKLREKHFDANKSNRANDHDVSNLRILFKKHDSCKKGYLTQVEFKNLLSNFGMNPSADHMYMMLCEYDPELNGTFNYENFIHAIKDKLILKMDMDLKSFIGGCLGGFAGIISSYPFDTLKVRIQNQHISDIKYSGSLDCLSQIIKKETASALYKGMSSPLVGSMFINAVLFGVEENVRKMLHLNDAKYQTGQKTKEFYELYAISGAIAGLTQSFLLSPVELVKIKMQIPNCQYKSTWCCTKEIIQNQGYRHLLRGTWLTVLRDVPGVSSYFVSFEYICNSFKTSRDNLPVLHLLMAGGIAGCFSWLITYPFDVIKTRFQADQSYTGVRDCIRKSLSTEGKRVFFRGLAPTLLRAFPNNAAVFATVTLFNRLMNKIVPDDNYELTTSTIPSYPNLHFFIDTYDMHR